MTSGRLMISAFMVTWLVGFVVLTGIEAATTGLEPGSIQANILVSFLLSPLGWAVVWVRNRMRKASGAPRA